MVKKEPMNTIYLVRHGENLANITHEFSCKHVDYSLTPKGVCQAQQTAAFFRDKDIHEIFASPLKRAKETAEIIAEPLGLPVTIMEHFREIDVGVFEKMLPTRENWELHNHYFEEWFNGNYQLSFPGGENHLTLIKRMRAGLCEVTHDKDKRNIVIIAHGGIFTRTMYMLCHNIEKEKIVFQPHRNCAVSMIELDTGGDRVIGMVKVWASHAHLSHHGEQSSPSNSLASPNKTVAEVNT
jgi:broad specificity phosphatase PhoE